MVPWIIPTLRLQSYLLRRYDWSPRSLELLQSSRTLDSQAGSLSTVPTPGFRAGEGGTVGGRDVVACEEKRRA